MNRQFAYTWHIALISTALGVTTGDFAWAGDILLDNPDVRATLDRATRSAALIDRRADRISCLLSIAELRRDTGDKQGASAILREIIHSLDDCKVIEGRPEYLCICAELQLTIDGLQATSSTLRLAADQLKAMNPQDDAGFGIRCSMYLSLAKTELDLGWRERALSSIRAAIEDASARTDVLLKRYDFVNCAKASFKAGDIPLARTTFGKAIRLAEMIESVGERADTLMDLCGLLADENDYDEALRLLSEIPSSERLALNGAVDALLSSLQGKPRELSRRVIKETTRALERIKGFIGSNEALVSKAEAAIIVNDFGEAQAIADDQAAKADEAAKSSQILNKEIHQTLQARILARLMRARATAHQNDLAARLAGEVLEIAKSLSVHSHNRSEIMGEAAKTLATVGSLEQSRLAVTSLPPGPPKVWTMIALAEAESQAGNRASAISTLVQAAELTAVVKADREQSIGFIDANAYHQIGLALVRDGGFEQAIGLNKDGGGPDFQVVRAIAKGLTRTGRLPRALEWAGKLDDPLLQTAGYLGAAAGQCEVQRLER